MPVATQEMIAVYMTMTLEEAHVWKVGWRLTIQEIHTATTAVHWSVQLCTPGSLSYEHCLTELVVCMQVPPASVEPVCLKWTTRCLPV